MSAQPWPEPDPDRGMAMSKVDIASFLGLAGKDTVEAWITRTRQGKAPVPFPPPDGTAVPPEGRPRKGVPFWWQATVESHQYERTRNVKRANVTVDTIHKVRRLLVDGETQVEVARACGVSTATVSRIANGKITAGSPGTPAGALERAQQLAEDLPTAGRWPNE